MTAYRPGSVGSASRRAGSSGPARPSVLLPALAVLALAAGCSGGDGTGAERRGLTYADGSGQGSGAAESPVAGADTDPPAVVVTYTGWDAGTGAVEVAGYVPDIIEDGGTCTLTLTRGAEVVSAEGPALSDATTTSCGTVDVQLPATGEGHWNARLAYSSSSSRSTSETFTVRPR